MHLYEIVVLVLALCLVKYTKAESETDTETLSGEETLARDANLDSTAYLKEDPEKAAEEDPKIPTKQDVEKDIGNRRVIPRVFIIMSVPTNHIFKIFHIKFCFRRSCYGKRILVIRYPSLVLFCKNLMTKSFCVNNIVQCILPRILISGCTFLWMWLILFIFRPSVLEQNDIFLW